VNFSSLDGHLFSKIFEEMFKKGLLPTRPTLTLTLIAAAVMVL
jgi:hypothetical protein